MSHSSTAVFQSDRLTATVTHALSFALLHACTEALVSHSPTAVFQYARRITASLTIYHLHCHMHAIVGARKSLSDRHLPKRSPNRSLYYSHTVDLHCNMHAIIGARESLSGRRLPKCLLNHCNHSRSIICIVAQMLPQAPPVSHSPTAVFQSAR